MIPCLISASIHLSWVTHIHKTGLDYSAFWSGCLLWLSKLWTCMQANCNALVRAIKRNKPLWQVVTEFVVWPARVAMKWSKSTFRVHTCMATGTIGAHQVVFTSGKPLKVMITHDYKDWYDICINQQIFTSLYYVMMTRMQWCSPKSICEIFFWMSWTRLCLMFAVVPDGMFLTYISAQNTPFAPWTAISFERTEGQRIDYVQLRSGNHFAINDWNPNSAPHQVTSSAATHLHGQERALSAALHTA